ncbi:hypothetical protein F5B21DRAFT_336069 [Xylaria acuta]|nr:hypothetical protein F5B21DRAFT_336069 [Xylaria acuta]
MSDDSPYTRWCTRPPLGQPILAQISRWNYFDIPTREDAWWGVINNKHFESVLYFLAVFAGFWPSRNVRSTFSWRPDMMHDTLDRWYLQVHFRCFTAVKGLGAGGDTEGLLCHREKGQIVSGTLKVSPHYFEERRISAFGLISQSHPRFFDNIPAFYSVLVLGETEFGKLDGYDLKWQTGLEGTIAFQLAVLTSADAWEREWNSVLDEIDDCLTFRLSQTLSDEEINKWMFDDDFGRSRLYLTILQILRFFDGRISTVSNDLGWLDDLFLKRPDFPISKMKQDELQVLRSNWELVRETQRKAEKSLLNRILYKIDEVKTLQGGLFNASSLREAEESTKMAKESSIMGRYVLIFTVVTVLYLPPTFISTVFALEIFKKDTAQTKWEYKVAIVSVSLLTYVASLLAVIAVTWKQRKHKCLQWWNDFKKWTSVHDSAVSATNVQAGHAPTQPQSNSNAAGSVPEVKDEESGIPKENKGWRSHFHRPGKSGESSGRREKGKAPDNGPSPAVRMSNE